MFAKFGSTHNKNNLGFNHYSTDVFLRLQQETATSNKFGIKGLRTAYLTDGPFTQ